MTKLPLTWSGWFRRIPSGCTNQTPARPARITFRQLSAPSDKLGLQTDTDNVRNYSTLCCNAHVTCRQNLCPCQPLNVYLCTSPGSKITFFFSWHGNPDPAPWTSLWLSQCRTLFPSDQTPSVHSQNNDRSRSKSFLSLICLFLGRN